MLLVIALPVASVPAAAVPTQGQAAPATAAADGAANETRVTILTYNDIQTAASDPQAMGRLAGTINERRAAHDNPTVVIGGGDQISPSSLSPISQWRVPVASLNEIDPDAEVVGNHDLDYGFAPVENYSRQSEFPWLLANVVREDGGGVPGTQNYTVIERDGVRIGVVGLVDEAIKPKTAVDFEEQGYRVADFSEVGSRVATKLTEEENADVVVAAAHIGVPESKELARETENIDVVVTGDDEVVYEPQTTDGTVIVEGEARGNYVGEVNLTVGEDGAEFADGRLVTVDESAPVNETVRDVVADARGEQLSTVVGRSDVELDSTFSSNYHDETAWGNLITDAFRAETGAEVAATNAGGIRGDFTFGPGNVTYDDVYTSLPFGNYLVTKELTGEQVRQLLASQVVGLDSEEGQQYGAEPSLQVSGVTYEYVPRGEGPTVRDVAVNGAPLRANETYNVTVNSYMADWSFENRYGWSMADAETVGTDYTLYGTATADYVDERSPVAPDGENRIRRVDRRTEPATVERTGENATLVRFDAPAAVESVNGSSFRVENETAGRLDARSVTRENGTVTVRFDRGAFERLADRSEELQMYGRYTDAEYDEQFVYFDEAVLDVPLSERRSDDGEAAIAVGSAQTSVGEAGEVAVTAASLPDGLSGGHLNVTVDDPSVARITGAEYAEGLGITAEPTVSDDGSTVRLRFADLDGAVEPGATDATLATLGIESSASGRANVTVTAATLHDDNGSGVEPAISDGRVVAGPPAVDGGDAPTDPDGDGRYEDLNGNGHVDYQDVVLLFGVVEESVVTDYPSAYDFNGNGGVDYDDVVALFAER